MKIYYLGPSKTYSEEAAEMLAGRLNCNIEAKQTLDEVLQNVLGENLGVAAYYNRTIGLMQDHLDLIKKYGLESVGRIMVPILIAIGKYPASRDGELVYSHEKCLAQCTDYLKKHNLRAMPVNSTSEGANIVKESKKGFAIAKKEALLESGLEIIAEDIANKDGKIPNFTDFLVVRKINKK